MRAIWHYIDQPGSHTNVMGPTPKDFVLEDVPNQNVSVAHDVILVNWVHVHVCLIGINFVYYHGR